MKKNDLAWEKKTEHKTNRYTVIIYETQDFECEIQLV